MLSVGVVKVLGTHMSSREAAKMGDILATEADLLGMIKEVTNSSFCECTKCNIQTSTEARPFNLNRMHSFCMIQHAVIERFSKTRVVQLVWTFDLDCLKHSPTLHWS